MTRTTSYLLQQRKERGSVLGIAAIGMTAILLAAGLCIDVGHWYLVTGELQNAADAAALAATSSLDGTAGGIIQAVDRAIATVNKYEFNGTNATISRADVHFAAQLSTFDTGAGLGETDAKVTATALTIRFVKVTVPPKSVSVFFASIATKSTTINLTRSAVAGFSRDLNSFGNIVPLAFMENSSSEAKPKLLQLSSTITQSTNCTNNTNNKLQYVKECIYNITVSNGNQAPVAGEYAILDLSSSRSSNDLRGLLGIGSDSYITSGQVIPLLGGNKIGQAVPGLNVRFDQYTANISATTYPPDANIREGITRAQYSSSITPPPIHPPGVWNRRVLIVPIFNSTQYDKNASTITPTKFGAFFMTSSMGNGAKSPIVVEYMGLPAVIGNGTYNPNGGAGTPDITTAVLYR